MKEYKVSNFILAKCGAKLERCTLGAGRRSPDRLANLVNQDLTLEPGYLISYIVAEDRPFSEVLTSSSTIMTGTMGEFMSHLGKDMWGNFPLGGYKDAAHPIFTNPQVFDRKLYRIERNNIHAGVLTTPAYQMLTNGARAKANKAYETFLCRKFVVPEGGKPDPNDANPDLTKRAYCSFCHKSLEPMAAFWNRWPEVGNVNYLYNASSTIDDSGRYDGKTGKGALAFGKILTESENFAECSVTRAFEFVYGRKMTKIEKENQLEDMIDKFNESGQKLRSTIKSLLLAPEFFNGKGE
ncbi:MAG: DUF1585 domain-containing protein [Proteobacteria bacterium]|nr:DUF1585 domain-containing protein [Pseudomonadota bacterium]